MKETADTVAPMSPAAARAGTFRALRHRNFRLLWIGLVISSLVMPMQWLVQSWLILQLTHSAFDLGLLGLARGLPMLIFGLWGGVLADRMDRRQLLIITQGTAMALVVLLASLIMAGLVQVWQVFLITFLTGAVQAFDQPTRTALVPDLVPREDLANAVALAAVARQVGTALGPAGGGFLIEAMGMGASYLLLAVGNAVIVLVLLLMKLPARSIGAVVR
ncbi:MAG: MFS transporter, partial [Chloroflexi bacterium]|nr:MFS transporter [Chloroflexota bacterium]